MLSVPHSQAVSSSVSVKKMMTVTGARSTRPSGVVRWKNRAQADAMYVNASNGNMNPVLAKAL